ncbi:hypothetical protein ACMD2_18228 [Ananas comosus]|uniref:Myb/SANT-like domain-containing protein n=1 Tax=Ananas comosus TaxID=4615 RepID=A0A199UDY4_ANACO|nr:hypothetical protein ACMD2_18228 [Ananas comosus]
MRLSAEWATRDADDKDIIAHKLNKETKGNNYITAYRYGDIDAVIRGFVEPITVKDMVKQIQNKTFLTAYKQFKQQLPVNIAQPPVDGIQPPMDSTQPPVDYMQPQVDNLQGLPSSNLPEADDVVELLDKLRDAFYSMNELDDGSPSSSLRKGGGLLVHAIGKLPTGGRLSTGDCLVRKDIPYHLRFSLPIEELNDQICIQPQQDTIEQYSNTQSIQQNFEAHDKQGTKNFKWTNEMSDLVIEFLVHQASIGMKVDKSFKSPAFVAAARAVSSKFQVSCNWTKVENGLCTFKMNLSGASWDPVSKTISLGDGSYQDFIRAHSKDICYLNCPIQHYDKLAIICGDDQATGEFALDDPNNINLDEEDNNDDGDDFGLEDLYSKRAHFTNNPFSTTIERWPMEREETDGAKEE